MIIPRVIKSRYLLPAGESPALVVPSGALTHQVVDEGEGLDHVCGEGVGGREDVRHGTVAILVSGEGDFDDGAVVKGEPVNTEAGEYGWV